jgi:hypothetical protein
MFWAFGYAKISVASRPITRQSLTLVQDLSVIEKTENCFAECNSWLVMEL